MGGEDAETPGVEPGGPAGQARPVPDLSASADVGCGYGTCDGRLVVASSWQATPGRLPAPTGPRVTLV